jgi:hypothetical protein
VQQVEELLRLLGRDNELYLDRESPCELEEARLVQDVMSAEASHRLEGGAAADAELVAVLEQPFPREAAVVPMTLMHVEPKYRSLHGWPSLRPLGAALLSCGEV